MKSRILKSMFFLVVLLVCRIGLCDDGGLSLELLNGSSMQSVLPWSPVQLIFKLTNTGGSTVVVPVQSGASILTGKINGHIAGDTRPAIESCLLSGKVTTTLAPGESVYTVYNAGPFLTDPGVREFRARFEYYGMCHTVQCWNGHIESEVLSISVVSPSAEDLQVLEYARSVSPNPGSPLPSILSFAADSLVEKFPQSSYSYAAAIYRASGIYGGEPQGAIKRMFGQNPGNALEVSGRIAIADYAIRTNKSLDTELSSVLAKKDIAGEVGKYIGWSLQMHTGGPK